MVPGLEMTNNICKRIKFKQCREKKEPTNLIHAAENPFTDSASVCLLQTAARFWPAAGLKDVISLPFLTSTGQKNRLRSLLFSDEIIQASFRGLFLSPDFSADAASVSNYGIQTIRNSFCQSLRDTKAYKQYICSPN